MMRQERSPPNYNFSCAGIKMDSDSDFLVQDKMNQSLLNPSENTFSLTPILPENKPEISSSEEKFQCEICGKFFTSTVSVRRHMYRHTQIKTYECRFCGKKFARNELMQNHLMFHIKKGSAFDCPIPHCSSSFFRHPHLQRHLETEHVTSFRRLPCKLCKWRFSNPERLLLHYQTRHDEVADAIIASGFYWTKPMTPPVTPPDHLGHVNISGNMTSDEFWNSEIKEPMMKEVSEDMPTFFGLMMKNEIEEENEKKENKKGFKSIQCDICSTSFCSVANLKRHQALHSKELPFKCLFCEKRYSRNDQVQEHSMIHFKKKSGFECPIASCALHFRFNHTLFTHMNMDHKVSHRYPAKCKLCEKTFYMARRLILHFMMGHNQKEESSTELAKIIKKEVETPPNEILDESSWILSQDSEEVLDQNTTDSEAIIRDNLLNTQSKMENPSSEQEIGDQRVPESEAPPAPLIGCDPCGIYFSDPSMYVIHQSLHSGDGEDPFRCGECGIRFVSKYQFYIHIIYSQHKSRLPF